MHSHIALNFGFLCLICFCSNLLAESSNSLVQPSNPPAQSSNVIRVNNYSDPNGDYAISMLKLAIAHSDTNYTLQVLTDDFSQAKVNEEVRINGLLDACWTSSDAHIESVLQPIRIPLFKGLLGYRIFIINKYDQSKFDNIRTLAELKQLKLGQGRTWADTRILEANGFDVVKVTKYPNLFHMVEGGRFDAFPRGVHEPFSELALRPELELAIEKKLMIYYKMPFYIFVSKDNRKLARDLEIGFERAIADGSFDKTFFGAKAVQDVISQANLKNRLIFEVQNPTLSKETPLDRKELWFDPKNLE